LKPRWLSGCLKSLLAWSASSTGGVGWRQADAVVAVTMAGRWRRGDLERGMRQEWDAVVGTTSAGNIPNGGRDICVPIHKYAAWQWARCGGMRRKWQTCVYPWIAMAFLR
jgi:hypothetical protein